ncbi:ketopantoate reductase family protein [Falsiroseomonas sp.]|uniref:ketopantoate reductase family protein n=1 Tax=Falsiroseomonas sp. TaxID=2870721 RepID=UPI003F6EB6CA
MSILVVGAGAVGGYIAAHLARAGEAVAVLEPWAPNRDAIRAHGLAVEEPSGDFRIDLPMIESPADVAAMAPSLVILCTKLADSPAMVAALAGQHAAPYLVTLNALADLDLAARIGADRVIGCIVTGLFANLVAPGRLQRHRRRGDGGPASFRLGEVSGPATPRIQAMVTRLAQVDTAEAVDDLPGARWTKLVFNAMTSPLCALRRTNLHALFTEAPMRAEMQAVALEVVAVADAAGITLDAICGIPGAAWMAAARGDAAAASAVDAGLLAYGKKVDPAATSGMAQDLARGRRTEVTLINGAVVEQAHRHGLAAPVNQGVIERLEALSTLTG